MEPGGCRRPGYVIDLKSVEDIHKDSLWLRSRGIFVRITTYSQPFLRKLKYGRIFEDKSVPSSFHRIQLFFSTSSCYKCKKYITSKFQENNHYDSVWAQFVL